MEDSLNFLVHMSVVEVQTIVVYHLGFELIYFFALPSLTRVCRKGKQVHLSSYLFIYSFAYFIEHCPIWSKHLRSYLAYSIMFYLVEVNQANISLVILE